MKQVLGILIVAAMAMIVACQGNTAADTVQTAAETVAETATTAVKKATAEIVKSTLNVGEVAPDFNLKNVDGSMVSLAGFEDVKGFIINFTCNTCPFAVKYEDRVIALQEKYKDKGYPVINIMPNNTEVKPGDSYDNMQERAKELGYAYYLDDSAQEVYPTYGASKTPHIFLLDAERVVRYIGAIDDSANDAESVSVRYLEDAIAALDAGKEPDPNFTKAIGCSIKVKK